MKIVAFCLCWVLIGATPGVMAQQTAAPIQSWDALRQLQAGEKIEVKRKTDKKKLSGKFVSISDTELMLLGIFGGAAVGWLIGRTIHFLKSNYHIGTYTCRQESFRRRLAAFPLRLR